MNEKQIDTFERLQNQFKGLYTEMQLLSKKSPNDGINKFKLGVINPLLKTANTLLGNSRRPIAGFTLFSEESLPTNSDVVIVLSQYMQALEKLHSDNVMQTVNFDWVWLVDGDESEISTYGPPGNSEFE